MVKSHVKKGDEVVVIAGSELGNRGKVLEVLKKKNRVLVEGLKMIKRHTKKSQANPKGAIIEREGTIHISNVVSAAAFDARKAKTATPAPIAATPAPSAPKE
jgi:large subunit ribosomal protein L24